jgi:hypothetical protein
MATARQAVHPTFEIEILRQSQRVVATSPTTHHPVEESFNRLALDLFQAQLEHNAAYRKFCQRRGCLSPSHWREIPAIPAVAFKELELTSIPLAERSTVFHSSGTSEHRPSRHYHHAASLALYEASLWPWFQRHFGDARSVSRLLFLTPSPRQAPHSSLVHMFDTVRQAFTDRPSAFLGKVEPETGAWTLPLERLLTMLRSAANLGESVGILGTAFQFVHLLDDLSERGEIIALPPGSRVMETGGYKGRSRALPRETLHEMIRHRLGIPTSHILSEYGMSELSSQAYNRVVSETPICESETLPSFLFPPWARVEIISPETHREVADGEAGLIRIVDLANVWSVLAVQTEDLGLRRGAGFELLGRSAQAEPRGCSLQSLTS